MARSGPIPIQPGGKRRFRRRWLALLGLALIIGLALVVLRRAEHRTARELAAPVIDTSGVPSFPPLAEGPFQSLVNEQSRLVRREETIGKKETLGHALGRLGLDTVQIRTVTEAVKDLLDLTQVRPGAKVRLWKERGANEPARIEYQPVSGPTLLIRRVSSRYVAAWRKYEPIQSWTAAGGTIQGSLWESAVSRQGLDPEVVMSFAELFASEVDFFTDIQPGDSYKFLFEGEYIQGRPQGAGRILAAEFVNKGKKIEMFHFVGADGKGDYYDAQGQSHHKLFLKSPLQYRRITSFFSKSRFHPILKYARPHEGVDYAAPNGTPVETVASGTVSHVGWKGGYGKTVTVDHKHDYMTLYAHLSGFAPGLAVGQKIEQGDLIGFVGSTGLSTGPHLDFRLRKGKVFVDPLPELEAQSAIPLEPAEKAKFIEQAERRRIEMNQRLAARPRVGG